MPKVNTRDRNKGKFFKDGKRKEPNWEYYFEVAKIGGKRKKISKAGFDKESDAYDAGIDAYKEYNTTGMKFTPSEISFSDYLDYWMDEYCTTNLKDTTINNYKKIIRLHIKPELGPYRLMALNSAALQSFINKKSNEGYSRNTMAVIKGILTGSLNYALEPAKFITTNPMQGVKLVSPRAVTKVPTRIKKKEIVTKEQWSAIIKRFPEGHSCYIPLLLAYHCGLRLGEVFALTWDDIDFNTNIIDINKQVQLIDDKWTFTNPKYDSFRKIKGGKTLMDSLLKEKERQERAKEYYAEYYQEIYISDMRTVEHKTLDDSKPVLMVNSRENGTYIQPRVTQHIGRIVHYQLGHMNYDFHSLRTTHATMLIEAGANPKAVQMRLGHKNIETTLNIYTKFTEKMENDAIDIFENLLE